MKEETGSFLAKARRCLANGRSSLGIRLNDDAGRSAYLAVFHASQGFIFERTGKAAKSHQGVQREFHRLALDEPRIDRSLPPFLTQAYNLKAVADYETGPGSEIPPERAAAALETAEQFIACIAALIEQ